MAEPKPAPVLLSTADPTPYVPVSWMAVAAAAVAGLFIVLLLALGGSAFLAKKPLVQPELLAFPAIGLVLAFAARRVIRNSEGTRTGESLCDIAWWCCLIAGLGYAAYLLAIDYSVRQDAKTELQRWVDNILAGDEVSFNRAFIRTREPGRRSNLSPNNTSELKGLFQEEYIGFEQSDLVRIARRNKDHCRFNPVGVKDWVYKGGIVDCSYSGELFCPEGKFPMIVALRGNEAAPGAEGLGRQWGVQLTPNGYLVRDQRSLTPYGWLVQALEESGDGFGKQFITNAGGSPLTLAFAYHVMIRPGENLQYWQNIFGGSWTRAAVAGGLAATFPFRDKYTEFFRDQFFKGPGGVEPSEEQKTLYRTNWDTVGLAPAGSRLRNSSDKEPIVALLDNRVEVRVPCELPFPGTDGNVTAARCRLVVTCSDPALVAELKQLRSEANPDRGSTTPSEDLRRRVFNWSVTRLESDMIRVRMPQRESAPGVP